MASNFTADGFTPRYSEEPLRSHRELNEIDQAHRDLTPRYRAALENTRGVVEQYIKKSCAVDHEALKTSDVWPMLKRCGVMPSYNEDGAPRILELRDCPTCRSTLAKEIEAKTEEALSCLRREELIK